MKTTRIVTLFASCMVCLTLGTDASARKPRKSRKYEVVITNLTRGQIISPPIIFTHLSGFRVFTPGTAASDELAAVAEDGVNGPLENVLDNAYEVSSREEVGTPVLPGQSVTVEIVAGRGATELTALGMLVVTNDAFFAGQGLALPFVGTRTYRAIAYDAGSEANTELCAHIPGPPCGSGGVRQTEGAEGFIHVHSGIHGQGDLVPYRHDWRNPVVSITITRIP